MSVISKKIAVITGASSGMGREFVLALDKQQEFDELWLIARRRYKLEALAAETRASIRAISLDLGVQSEIDKYKELLEAETPDPEKWRGWKRGSRQPAPPACPDGGR